MMAEAEAFLKQCYAERGLMSVFSERFTEVRQAIEQTGTYEQTFDELAYGAKLAWRNSNRCIGRNFWQNLNIRDMRHLETEAEMFQSILEHIKFATNKGDLRATITIFKPDGRRIWSSQYFRYAGYRQPDGSILGDPGNVEFTEQAMQLGWRGAGTRFDYLPIILQLPGREPQWFEIPPELI
jgi:nitric-oxide synthase